MNPVTRIIGWLKPAPKSAEEIEAAQEAARLYAKLETTRMSAQSSSGENYQSGRRT